MPSVPLGATLKPGVRLAGIQPQVVLAFLVARDVYDAHGFPLVLTSAVEGTHMRQSLHYQGRAIDIRSPSYYGATRNIDELVGRELAEALGGEFDVVVEGYAPRPDGSVPAKHIHIEYDPKEGVA